MITQILTWLAGAVALCGWLAVAAFAAWGLIFTEKVRRADEHD
jgi:hypothetical protein